MHKILTTIGVSAVLGLSACSQGSDLDRALIGAALGCAAGEILRDGKCIEVAVVGAAAGALADDV